MFRTGDLIHVVSNEPTSWYTLSSFKLVKGTYAASVLVSDLQVSPIRDDFVTMVLGVFEDAYSANKHQLRYVIHTGSEFVCICPIVGEHIEKVDTDE